MINSIIGDDEDGIDAVIGDIEDRLATVEASSGVGALAGVLGQAYDLEIGVGLSNADQIKSYLTIYLRATTNGSGVFTMDFDDFPDPYTVEDVYGFATSPGFVDRMGRSSDGVPVFLRITAFDSGNNTVTFVARFGDGALVASTAISGTVQFAMTELRSA
jgi:hypothetical protein